MFVCRANAVVVDREYEPSYSPRRAKGDGRDEGGLLGGSTACLGGGSSAFS